jgi:SAM-dependent methyltransferase
MTNDASAETADERLDAAKQRSAVREQYARIAADTGPCCGDGGDGTAPADADTNATSADANATSVDAAVGSCDPGYSDEDRDAVGSDAELSLGCGNPTAIAGLDEGDTVLDLGSGAGFDCFLAARAVGETGRVVGVDMTPAMIETARENLETSDAGNVEFRLGEIEHLPAADESVDVVISNCVVNLSPDKRQVFREAYRVLRPGGRLAISDIVLTGERPADWSADPDAVAACVGDAAPISDLEAMLSDAGFVDVTVEPKADDSASVPDRDDGNGPAGTAVSATIEAEKPARNATENAEH